MPAQPPALMPAQRSGGAEDLGLRRAGRTRVWAGLAAAGLVAVTATVTHELTKRSMSPLRQRWWQPQRRRRPKSLLRRQLRRIATSHVC